MTTSDVTAKSAYDVSEFTIAIPDEKLDDMYERLRRTRFPKDFGNDDWGTATTLTTRVSWSATGSRTTTGVTWNGG